MRRRHEPRPPSRPSCNPRRHAIEVVSLALDGRAFAQDEIDSRIRAGGLSEPDGRLLAQIAFGVIRRRLTLDTILAALIGRPLDRLDPAVLQILRVGAFQIVFLDRVPPHAAVNESVSLARATGHAKAAGLVNAVLRRLTRIGRKTEGACLESPRRLPLDELRGVTFGVDVFPTPDDRSAYLAAIHSFPPDLVLKWTQRLGEPEAVRIMRIANAPAPLSLRPNTAKTTVEELAAELAQHGVHAQASASGRTLRLPVYTRVTDLKAFREGRAQPQDDSAAAVVPFLDPRPGEDVLDLCAAPGGKTTQIAERLNGEGALVAVDVSQDKLARVQENMERLGLPPAACVEADGVKFAEQWRRRFDAVLVDVPCSNSGVLRRRPEARWRLSRKALKELTTAQVALLRAGLQTLREGGRLVYSTCSIEPEENGELVRGVLADSAFRVEGEVEILPSDEADGAYMALIRPGAEAPRDE